MTRLAARRWTAALALASLALPSAPPLAAVEAPPLTLEQAMADPDWIGNPPLAPYWADDGRAVYYERKRDGEERRDLFRLDLASGQATRVEDAQRGGAGAPGGDLRPDRKARVYEREGDLFFKDLTTGKVRQLTRTARRERQPLFLADGRSITFHVDKEVFLLDLASGLVSQAADLKLEKDPAEEEDPTYLSDQQRRLFEVIRDKKRRETQARDEERAAQKADPTRPPLPFYLGEELTIEDTALAPSGEWLAAVTSPKSGANDKKPSKLATFVTESGQIEVRDVRTKVGLEKQSNQTVILFDLKRHERHDLDWSLLPGIKDDPLKALREAAKARQEARKATKKAEEAERAKAAGGAQASTAKEVEKEGDGKPEGEKKGEGAAKKEEKPSVRPVEVVDVNWSDDGRRLAVELRSRDNKDRWIATYDTADGKLTPRHRLTDPAWINDAFDTFGWLRDNESLFFLSEETGTSHLYLLSTRDGSVRRLTEGPFEVSEVTPSFDRKVLYYRANREHPGIYEVYRVDVARGKSEQLTRLGGFNSAVLAPDEGRLLLLHSSVDRPDELYVQDNRPGAQARQLSQTRSAAFLAQTWTRPEIVPIPSTHGAPAPIYSRVFTPDGFDAARADKYPAVVFIHGAGYLQNAHYGWSSYFHEFMFHTLLTRKGYVVLDMDYRGSAGYGRDWRTAIYRQMGHPELEDLADGVAWLAEHRHVDAGRVGAYGGSYGGFLTFMALFRQPDLFAAGAALRPVSDWAHYNQPYTANILNTPDLDPDAYAASSPIEFAAGLTKPLLICDGMIDDNVFFQDTVRVVQRLIELKKETFETAIYPVERHAFVQPTSWLDEYRRILKLFEAHLR
jgi:dipeptidyl aminopeptidase/acylaminoacyl peptidase